MGDPQGHFVQKKKKIEGRAICFKKLKRGINCKISLNFSALFNCSYYIYISVSNYFCCITIFSIQSKITRHDHAGTLINVLKGDDAIRTYISKYNWVLLMMVHSCLSANLCGVIYIASTKGCRVVYT